MKLKSTSDWLEEGNGINSVGFNLCPSGLMETGIYKTPGNVFWTWTSIDNNSKKWCRWISKTRDGIMRYDATSYATSIAGSVRCIKDSTNGNQPPVASFTISPESGTNYIRYTIDATGCCDDKTSVDDLEVRWDFDYENDPGWDTDFSTEKFFEISFQEFHKTYQIRMEVRDSEGFSNIATHSVKVSNMGSFVDSRDNKTYTTVLLDSQTWMAENLAWLPSVSNSTDESTEDPYYYVYGYEGSVVAEAKQTDNYNTYGVLYNYPASMIACPAGWHLPSDEEFMLMEEFLGMDQSELSSSEGFRQSGKLGKNLKSESGWNSEGNGVNRYGFNILPAGTRMWSGGFDTMGEWVGMWTSSRNQNTNTMYWVRGAVWFDDGFQRDDAVRDFGYTVRCVKDE